MPPHDLFKGPAAIGGPFRATVFTYCCVMQNLMKRATVATALISIVTFQKPSLNYAICQQVLLVSVVPM